MNTNIAKPGKATSPITPALVAQATAAISEPRLADDGVFWLENRPGEGGRTTLVKAEGGRRSEWTPAPFNVRSRVHEYGGAAYLPVGDAVFFVNAADQNIYAARAGGQIRKLTGSGPSVRYADLCFDSKRERLVAVTEIHGDAGEPTNALAAVTIADGKVDIVHRGHDFYASPRVSPSGDEILFVAWDHPNMPWNGTQLLRASLTSAGLGKARRVAGGAGEAVLQPSWLSDDSALYLSDATGYWNLHRLDSNGTDVVLTEDAEYAGPSWQFGDRDYAIASERFIAARRERQGEQSLALLDLESGTASALADSCAQYSQLCARGNVLYFLASRTDAATELASYDLSKQQRATIATGPALDVDAEWLSPPRHIAFDTRDGGRAFAWLYLPASAAPPMPGGRPPLLVTTHGGPTGAASPALRLATQFYASRGWVVADINYRGSSGYGRRYRDALQGQWGLLDVTDCVDAVNHLAGQGLIDPSRVAIRGGSAGGYTTLRALTTETVFRAGASHYGIGDLAALADDTHKFESQYLFELVGEREALIERSPIHHLDGFNCPVIFFQGAEDKVVPPNQARAMVAALKRKGLPVAYLEFAGEGHGFRDGANVANAIGSEYAFFCRVFELPVNENLPEPRIENL